jgi:hypothetical protein
MDRNPSTGPTRRKTLGALAAAGLGAVAGCNALGNAGTPAVSNSYTTDVVACSVADTEKTVTVTVRAAGAEDPRTDRTLSLSPGEVINPVNDGKFPGDGYTVEVDIEEGPSETFEWTEVGPERAPLWVLIPENDNVRFLLDAQ